MKSIVLSLSLLALAPTLTAQEVVQHFTGVVTDASTLARGSGFFTSPIGSPVTGTFTINTGTLGYSSLYDVYGDVSWSQVPGGIPANNGDYIAIADSSGTLKTSDLQGAFAIGGNGGVSYGQLVDAANPLAQQTTASLGIYCDYVSPNVSPNPFLLGLPSGCTATIAFDIWYAPYSDAPLIVTLTSLNGIPTTPNKGLGDPGCRPGACQRGNPISIGNGNKYEQVVDYRTQGNNSLTYERFYNSLSSTGSLATTLGAQWRSNYDRFLRIISSSSVVAERADGQEVSFSLNGSAWTCDSDTDVSLSQTGNSWTLTDQSDNVESYTNVSSMEAALKSITARNGYHQTLERNYDQTLASLTDTYGRSLTFMYQNGLVQTVTTPDNTVLTFGYTSQGSQNLLTSVSYSTTPVTTVSYGYDPSQPTLLTSLTDENGTQFASWTYDSQGRALTSQHGNGAELTTVTYNDIDNSRTVTNALGVTDTYSFSIMQGVPKVTQISRAATPTTAAATQSFTYDPNGYVSGKTDWNNNTTTYTNDAHG